MKNLSANNFKILFSRTICDTDRRMCLFSSVFPLWVLHVCVWRKNLNVVSQISTICKLPCEKKFLHIFFLILYIRHHTAETFHLSQLSTHTSSHSKVVNFTTINFSNCLHPLVGVCMRVKENFLYIRRWKLIKRAFFTVKSTQN